MKILLIHQYFKEQDVVGGARFNEMTKVWKGLGHDITVLAGDLDGQSTNKKAEYKKNFITKKDQNGIEVWRCNVSESYNKNFLGRLWGYFSFVFSSTYAGVFKLKGDYDVIIVTSPPLFVGITAYIISILKKKPIVFEVRDLWPESAIDTGVLKNKFIIKLAYWFESFIYKKAKLINVLTPAFERKLIKEKKINKDKILFIPNAADFDMADGFLNNFDVDEFKKEHGLSDKFIFTYIGAHGVANDLQQILDVASKVKNDKVVFLLIGNGMKKAELINSSKMMGLTNIIFKEAMPKVEALKFVAASDVGVSILKKVDTFKTIYSNKTFDYMSCKKPILLAIDGVSKELVELAKCGVYVEPENIEEITKGVEYLANLKSEDLNEMGNNGYKHAKLNFDRKKLAVNYINEIKEKLNV